MPKLFQVLINFDKASVYYVYGGEKESAYNAKAYLYSPYEAAISHCLVFKYI